MPFTFHNEERRPRTVIRVRPAAAQEEAAETAADRERVMGALIAALDPFPEARAAVVAALKASEAHSGRME